MANEKTKAKLGKLAQKRQEFEAAVIERERIAAETIRNAEEELKNFKLSEEDEKELEKLGEKGVSIKTDFGTEVLDMIDSLSESFSPKKLSEPVIALFEKSDDEAAEQFEIMFGEHYDSEELSKDDLVALLHDTWDIIVNKFAVDRSEGITDRVLAKLQANNILYDLDEKLIVAMTGATTRMMSKDKYSRIVKDLSTALGYIAIKDSLDMFIENETIEMEIYTHVERYLADLKISITEGNYIDPQKIFQEIKEILKEEGIVDFKDATISFIFEKKKKNLIDFANILENNNHEDERVKKEIIRRAEKYRGHAAAIERVTSFEFMTPYITYCDHLAKVKNKNSAKHNKAMEAELASYITKLKKYNFSIPFPGYKKEDKSFRDLVISMTSFFNDAIANYNEKKPESYPDIRDLSEVGFENSDLGFVFSMYVINILMRFDKKYMKHLDFKEDKERLLEYVFVYRFICGANEDLIVMRGLVHNFNKTLESYL